MPSRIDLAVRGGSTLMVGRSGCCFRQLQHVCGEINVILLAIAIGLAILDYTYFLSLQLAAVMAR